MEIGALQCIRVGVRGDGEQSFFREFMGAKK